MQRKDSTRQPRPKIVTTTEATDDNSVLKGDRVTYIPSENFKDGERVVMQSDHGSVKVVYLFNIRGGKRYRYYYREERHANYGSGNKKLLGDERDDWKILGVVQKVRTLHNAQKTEEAKPQVTGEVKRSAFNSGFNCSLFGVHINDTLIVERSGKAPIGKLILVNDGDEQYLSRVCTVKDDTVRLCDFYKESEARDEPLSQVVGPIVEIKHDNCAATKLTELRARLARLQEDDDHTLNLTKCYEIEQEIYKLEGQLSDDYAPDAEDDFEWPEVIGDE